MYKIYTLYSGSRGNSVFIEAKNTRILIDAGKNAKALCTALCSIGSDIKKIDAIFITHEHTDHISALEIISKRYSIPIHITSKSALKIDRYPDSFASKCLIRHDDVFEEEINGIKITAFKTPHDSLMSVGYRIEFCEDEKKHSIGLATDIGYITKDICQGLCGCETVVLESNHDVEMLTEGPYPYDLKKRILSKRGHLSNKDSALLAAGLAKRGTRSFILAHLSEENNTPDTALDEFLSTVADSSVRVAVAHPEEPTEIIT
jgi:phosphoribosyl 1,2-cyclic phosphodiesterase